MLAAHVEVSLFAALDRETDASTAAQLKATLRTLLAAGAPAQPSYWLTCTANVALAAAPAAAPSPARQQATAEPIDLQGPAASLI